MNLLVAGGAGYIGSHTCKVLAAAAGHNPVTLDNLSTGHRSAVRWGPLVVGCIADQVLVSETISKYDISGCLHFAASAYVGESTRNPRKYFHNNVVKSITFLDALLDSGVRAIIFSSSCATYGIPKEVPIGESHPQNPINPYGETKLAFEKVLRWYGEAYGLRAVTLRYFNAAGADPEGEIGEDHGEETHLIPLAIRAALDPAQPLRIFGSDYPTKDGTAVRDYIHVTDLAQAHRLALDYCLKSEGTSALNLGTGIGHSIGDVRESIRKITGRTPVSEFAARRPGDPPELVADARKAQSVLQWTPEHSSIDEIIRTASAWAEKSYATSPASESSTSGIAFAETGTIGSRGGPP